MSKNVKQEKKDMCEVTCFDEDVVKRVQPKLEELDSVELLFKALSDATRLKITYALTIEKELCVCDVANIMGTTAATASHHLRYLRNMGLAKYRKEGKLVFYSIVDDHVRQLLTIALEHSKEIRKK
ncbi:metalloregulator ArsR/SmtB family transcription factor [Psychrobacillus sp. FSL H8-0484]|uniref:ArsR/SmtB family transcription factor n=1 Tax=Psychrobacillus sp. FSL H8-0484 TaxID=2921390 RepID=UPI0030FB132A